jgi:hypothetical protein
MEASWTGAVYRFTRLSDTNMPFQKSLWIGQRAVQGLGFERGEVVSPIGCIAGKVSV